MMKRHLIGRGTAVLLSAGLLTLGGLTANAADIIISPATETAQAAFTADDSFTVVKVDLTENYGYDIISTDTDPYVDDDNPGNSSRSTSSSTKSNESKNWVKIILIALAVSVIGTAVAVIIIYRGYKYNGQTEPYEFKNKAPLELREKEDVLIDVRVTTQHIERDNK